ncbi:FKBP-type peptidyl-prolyl cis-trans isomerase [Aquimarina sp. MMG016]|uniref:FKBP-type peptidyl-prolyl cis-trans isomerase n=1 Tax=Aquimarina sp. MMG016 TaxID=2822690 RepID=UPI001B3A220E|nr:FKBP-type peptidyl-prolyl cis-trans isomerase [Aquimarina sp. MMG016]MBQ4821505.1 FKBP-type peptidyl-prolyl cis-trans isomerase [Aquimarina sp. MMG016]
MKYTIFAFVIILFVSCNTSTDNVPFVERDYTEANEQEITKYLEDNNLIAEKSDTGLYYIIDEPGTGAQPTADDNVTVAYKGYFTNGTVFDESSANGVSFGLRQVIQGWTEGIPYFKEGGSGTLLIPAHLGYGGRTIGPIPAGSVLLFDVKLISVN